MKSRVLLWAAALLFIFSLPQACVPAEKVAGHGPAPLLTAQGEKWERTPGLPRALLHQWIGSKDKASERRLDPQYLRTVDTETAPLSLAEAIQVALANNPRIAAQRLVPVSVKQEILKAQARYDSTLSLNLSKDLRQQPTGSVLAGATGVWLCRAGRYIAGVRVTSLEQGSPAQRAGIHTDKGLGWKQAIGMFLASTPAAPLMMSFLESAEQGSGDIIVAIDGKPVRNTEAFERRMKHFRAEQVVSFSVLRGGRTVRVPVRLPPSPERAEGE